MDIKTASIKLSFEKTKTELVSVKLRVTFNRVQRRYAFPIKSGVMISEKDFDRLLKYHEKGSERIAEEIRLLYGKIQPFLVKAEALASSIKPFSFDAFKEAFYFTSENILPSDQNDVLALLISKGAAMRKDNRIGNAVTYELAGKSLRRFVDSFSDEERKEFMSIPLPSRRKTENIALTLRFEHITPDFLKVYEQWMLSKGKLAQSKKMSTVMPENVKTEKQIAKWKAKAETAIVQKKGEDKPATLTTVGIYCRHLRSVYNDAIAAKIVSSDLYPFGKNGYTIPAGTNTKKALSKADVLKIMSYQCSLNSFEQRGRDLWVFSYLSNGMNMTDICKLKWSDIDRKENSLSFIRQKTARTRKGNQIKIRVKLFEESWNIINRYASDIKPGAYVFPFLKPDMTEQQKKITVSQVIKMTNQHMRSIAKTLEIDGDASTYSARHSFATILLQSEAPIAFISQSLGHTNISTTQAYLGSFDDEKTKQYLNALI